LSSLLRPRRKWSSGRTAEQRNEITPFITANLVADWQLWVICVIPAVPACPVRPKSGHL
jgi:hypothetical protein